ncbi:hypothetical protein E6W39_10805 [Kitasatospora acidiphila]|uniref:Uncharacterized protein n=1 Tax=Kitasatospora acidiphila TaxID=2567942 RepID=A0A540W0V7_9ACTN|nr:hypothetical protein [Kitasatospora acidiphila]TQF02659.1 hypothetical protein E6W39_10805 [Kitasatospora acidiphila]
MRRTRRFGPHAVALAALAVLGAATLAGCDAPAPRTPLGPLGLSATAPNPAAECALDQQKPTWASCGDNPAGASSRPWAALG